MLPPPPPIAELPYGTRLVAGLSHSTVLADMDFETYSEAGYVWDESSQKWRPLGKNKAGISAVGLRAYAEHPSTEILSLSYDLKDGTGRHVWLPGLPFPQSLREHIASGRLLAAWNSMFEFVIWTIVGERKYGFPPLPLAQLRCDMAKSRAFCLPGKLSKAGEVLGLSEQTAKLAGGDAIVKRYCTPRSPTKADPSLRIHPLADGAKGFQLYAYNGQDIIAEANVSARVPDLNDTELAYWLVDQECNFHGVQIDVSLIDAMVGMLDEIYVEADREIQEITQGAIESTTEVAKIQAYLAALGVSLASLDDDAVSEALAALPDEQPLPRRILQLRQMTSSASVRKAYTIKRMLSKEGRLHDLFIYHSARTGRDAGADAQPQNLTSGGPEVSLCPCGVYHSNPFCPTCAAPLFQAKKAEWGYAAVEQAIPLILNRDRASLRQRYGSEVAAMSGCIRSVFMADAGHDFVATDYSSIEAVVAAALAGEQWRLDALRANECIYLASVSQIKGTSVQEYKDYKTRTKLHHPDRKIGKVAELASGFGGWTGAWKAFGAESVFSSEQDLKAAILAWRAASPNIVEMWGGQTRGKPWEADCRQEFFGLEGCALQATLAPGTPYSYRGVTYLVHQDVLYCTLPSGRHIAYHSPRVTSDPKRQNQLQLSFEGWNTNIKIGPKGWIRMTTYGGKLFENVVQATARDILVNAAINCEKRGYRTVFRVHDELVTQVPEGVGSVEELEAICGELPAWAEGWPIRAAGGWRGKRYRKD